MVTGADQALGGDHRLVGADAVARALVDVDRRATRARRPGR